RWSLQEGEAEPMAEHTEGPRVIRCKGSWLEIGRQYGKAGHRLPGGRPCGSRRRDQLARWSRIGQSELADVWRSHRADLPTGRGRWGCRMGISSPRLTCHPGRPGLSAALAAATVVGCCDSAGSGLRACPSGSPHFRRPSCPPGAARAKSLLRIAASDTTPATIAMIAATRRMRSRPVVKAVRVITPTACRACAGSWPIRVPDLPRLHGRGDLRALAG